MSTTFESFVSILKRSGLLSAERLQSATDAFRTSQKELDTRVFAQELVDSGDLTEWQTEKLLKGRHKGFFLGKYKLMKIIGKGGMSSVYLAEHVLMKRLCAIKVLPWKLVSDSSFLQRFYREAQMVAQLDHPNIVRAYDIDHEKEGNLDIHFLVMEYVSGRNLFEIVTIDGPMPVEQAMEYLRQGCAGLAYAHRAGLVHRDIKPGNFIVDDAGHVRLMDLGLARLTDTAGETSLTVAHDEKVLGTADYLAPEQAVDSHSVDPRADIYSLGCTLYFMLTGEPPFNEGTLTQRLLAHQTKQPPAIEAKRPDVPNSVAVILRKLMEKQRDNRYQTADEVLEVLTNWLAEYTASSNKKPATVAGAVTNKGTLTDDRTVPKQASSKPIPRSTSAATGPATSPATGAQPTRAASSAVKRQVAQPVSGPPAKPMSQVPRPTEQQSAALSANQSATYDSFAGISIDAPSDLLGIHETSDLSNSGEPTAITRRSKVLASAKESPRFKMSRRVSIAAGSVAVLVLLVVAYILFRPDPAVEAPTVVPVAVPAFVRPEVSGTTLTVGPQGNFGTLAEALAHTRHAWLSGGENSIQEIRIAEGITLTESLMLDNSALAISRPLQIIGEGANPPLLKPTGSEPVLFLRGSEQFLLENVRLSGAERPIVADLGGYMVGSRLNRVRFENVTGTAVTGLGVRGLPDRQFTLSDCTFQFADASSVGIEFNTESLQDTAHVTFQNCRFLGPAKAAIQFSGATQGIRLQQNIFHQCRTAVAFSGTDVTQSNLFFLNNTFHRCHTGFEFAQGLTAFQQQISFSQNLFVQQQDAEVAFKGASKDAAELSTGLPPARSNWTERAGGGPGELDIFSLEGRRGVPQMTFVSEDPKSPDFLKPLLVELTTSVTQPINGLPFVGAISP